MPCSECQNALAMKLYQKVIQYIAAEMSFHFPV